MSAIVAGGKRDVRIRRGVCLIPEHEIEELDIDRVPNRAGAESHIDLTGGDARRVSIHNGLGNRKAPWARALPAPWVPLSTMALWLTVPHEPDGCGKVTVALGAIARVAAAAKVISVRRNCWHWRTRSLTRR